MGSRLCPATVLNIPEVLRQDHEEIRVELSLAMRDSGPVAEAAKRLTHLCLAHFELEETILLPAFAKLHDLILRRAAGREVAQLVEQITGFSKHHKHLHTQHASIASEVELLLESAQKVGDKQATELAYTLKNHEQIEDAFDLSAYQLSIAAKEVIW